GPTAPEHAVRDPVPHPPAAVPDRHERPQAREPRLRLLRREPAPAPAGARGGAGRGRLHDPVVIARVHPLVTARAVDQGFDYAAGDGVERGALVEVELGSRTVRGVVTEVAEGDGEGLKPVIAVLGSVPGPLLELAEWIAASYASTLSRALGLVLAPPAGARAPEPWVRL